MKLHLVLSLSLLAPTLCSAQTLQTAAVSNIDAPGAHTAPLPATLAPAPRSPLIVIGFAGGFIRRTSVVHGEIALSHSLAQKYGPAIQTEIFENHHGDDAHREILRLIAANQAAQNLAPGATPATPRIILYGHSWGASETVDVARQLQQDGIPVLLLFEVDGVRKHQHDDAIIPANVAQAINFYQTEGLLHGRRTIYAADPASTRIIGNIHLSYRHHLVPTPGFSWFMRTVAHRHIEIESDPRVWNRIEAMIAKNLPQSGPVAANPPLTATAAN